MADWTRDKDGAACTEIDGNAYRVRLHGSGAGFVAEARVRSDWSRFGSPFDAEEDAKADVLDYARHLRDVAGLERAERSFAIGKGTSTPWGQAQTATRYGRGVTFYSTASHGGFKVSDGVLATFPPHLKNSRGWYEEDCEWAAVAIALPDLFTLRERFQAEKTLRDWAPAAWEKHFGRALVEGESYRNDEILFSMRHRHDWVVISALNSSEHPGMVTVIASEGGIRGSGAERKFLVSSEEYRQRDRFGFVVDLTRHEEIGTVSPDMRF